MTYQEQIKHPKWQKKRLEILQRDNYECVNCKDKETQLHVHHMRYFNNKLIWEYDNKYLKTMCSDCHSKWHKANDKIKEYMSGLIYYQQIEILNNLLENLRGFDVQEIYCLIDIVKKIKDIKHITETYKNE